LALAAQYAARNDQVIAVCRTSSTELDALSGVRVISGIDVTSGSDLARLSEAIEGDKIDVLINNAGLLVGSSWPEIEDQLEYYRRQFEVNALSPLRVTHAVSHGLVKGSKVIIITSRMGSMGDNTSGGQFAYRMSKAAVNSAGVSLAHELKPKGVALALLHPGYVRTDMTHRTGHIDPDESAKQLIERIDECSLASLGSFIHASGEHLPW